MSTFVKRKSVLYFFCKPLISSYETFMENDSTKLNTIGKAIAVFEAIRSANRALSIKELADALGLNKSSLHHHIKTLTEFGYLQQDSASRKYDIGLKLVSVGQTYLQRLDVRERGHLFLEQLSVELNETVHMLVLDHNQAVYVDKVEVQRPPGSLQCSSFIGMRTHLHSTASGKVLLSNLSNAALGGLLGHIQLPSITQHTVTDLATLEKALSQTKDRGYGLDLQENGLGLQCVAVPILDLHSQCIAAISASTLVSNTSQEALEGEVLEKLKETGLKISMAMGYAPA